MQLRSLIRDVMPPVLFRVAQRISWRVQGVGTYTFEGCYPTLADVPKWSQYSDAKLAAQAVERGLARFKKPQLPLDDHVGRTILPLVISLVPRPVTVIDFGGSICVGLCCIRAYSPALLDSVSYVLVETPAICAALRGHLTGITVTDGIPTQATGTVVVNASSSLQYIDDWRATLKRLAALKPQRFIVSNTPFTNGKTYARQQTNDPHQRLACWVFNRTEFASTMAQLGFYEDFAVEYDLPITHKDSPSESSVSGSIVFRP